MSEPDLSASTLREQCVFYWQGRFTMSAPDVGLVSSRREAVSYKFVNESVNPDPVKCLLDIQKDSTSGPSPLETRGNFFRESE
ncbi:hypothetical protein TNCV_3985481 [Trichonephila clavipes]|nr:hypothetical protein TNCV_3985481 [Trichonephila clavipes]